MANKSFTVQYLIKARDLFTRDANKAAKALGGIDKQGKKVNDTLKKTSKQSKIAAKNFKKSSDVFKNGLKGIAGFAVGALGGLAGIVTVGAKFQTSMADVQAITGATGKDLDFLKNKAMEMAVETVTNQNEVANAIKLVGSAKPELLKNIPALLAMTEQVLLLKNAGVETDIAAKAVAGGLNAFGKSAEFASKYVNILAAGSQRGSSEIRDTADAVTIAGPNARAAGLSFLQLNAAIQATARGNIFGSQAGTALSAIFGRLRRSGLDIQKLGLEKTFEIIGKKLDDTKDPTKRARLEAKIFGEEHGKVGLALVKNAKLMGSFENSLKDTNVAQEQADIRLGTFAKSLEKILIIIQGPLTKVFDRLAPKLKEIAVNFGAWFSTVTDDDIRGFADTLGAVLNVAVLIGQAFGFAFKMLDSIGKMIGIVAGGATEVIGDIFGGGGGDKESSGSRRRNSRALRANGNSNITNKVDVGVQVGLDQGLKQTSPTRTSRKSRRQDRGAGFAEVPA